jgi:hypothetical protein
MRNTRIRAAASQALSGADYVRANLLGLLATGPDSIADLVYAVKCRVKAEESLVKKVIFKRKERPAYSAQNVTDIIGLRLLGLTSEHLPTVCERFIAFIRFCQQPEVSLFAGEALDDAIREVKIYKSQANPVIYEKIYVYFQGLNLKPDKIALEAATDEDPYSYRAITFCKYLFVANVRIYSGRPNKLYGRRARKKKTLGIGKRSRSIICFKVAP